jgi:hypothetical protein
MENTREQTPRVHKGEAFWNHHLEMQKSSGLSQAKYCRENGLNYTGFLYWQRKKSPQPNSFISVKLKSAEISDENYFGRLHFSNGCYLSIHDAKALALILSEMRR